VFLGGCSKCGHRLDQSKAVVIVKVSPGAFHRVSAADAEVGTKVPIEFRTIHTGSFPCRCTVPSGWLDICPVSLAGDSGYGRPGGIGSKIQASNVSAYRDSSRVLTDTDGGLGIGCR
jgi:hypothetical protein